MKKIIIATLLSLSFYFSAAYAVCVKADPDYSPTFCSTFKTAATCYCKTDAPSPAYCQTMDMIYTGMLAKYGSIDRACHLQTHTTPQDCIDGWNCYKRGGVDSAGRACSSTGRACG